MDVNCVASYQPSMYLKTNASYADSGEESLFTIQKNVATKEDSNLKEKNSPGV